MSTQSSEHDSSDEDHSVPMEPEREIKCPVHGYSEDPNSSVPLQLNF
jgi:hypothetical protein